ncbi:HIT family protein [Phenylobacterium sp.]|jgi:diadenosine tetraphosphate (Ap4A) HIT family hydrolase|uniref:HIT family protein n=1 Tax=Phenylobacterium sp. TaxID=1871053 RepID=UPI002F42016A
MTNATAVSFGFPDTVVGETACWLVLARPKQPTFGSLVLICKHQARAFSDIGAEAFADLRHAVSAIEAVLAKVVAYRKINYLMLMMVDPDVHFHVIPRYEGERVHEGTAFPDAGWPGPPDLAAAVDLGAAGAGRLAATLRASWPAA